MAKLAVVILTFFLLGAVYAQTFVDLVPGATAQAGSLLPELTIEMAQWNLVYYRLWVPTDVNSLSLTFSQTDSVCTGDIRYYIHADHVPCGTKWSEGSNADYPCRDGVTDYFTDSSSDVVDLFPGSYLETANVKPGSYLYVSLGRDVPSSDYDQLCTFTILTTLTTCATAGQVGVNVGSTPSCTAVTDVATPYTTNWNGGLTETYLRLWVPERTAQVKVWVNNTDFSTYVAANPHVPGGSSNYWCSDSYNTNAAGVYELDMTCFNPPKGWFYIYFYTLSTGYTLMGNVSVSTMQCAENRAGYNCTYQAWNLTGAPALAGAAYGVEPNEGGSSSISTFGDGFKIWYLTAANGTMLNYNFTVTLTTGTSSWVYYNRNGFIADSSAYYQFYTSLVASAPQTVALLWNDFYAGGNYYFGISNEGSAVVNFTLSTAAASASSSTTDASTTAATTGSASTVFASFALIAALIALLF